MLATRAREEPMSSEIRNKELLKRVEGNTGSATKDDIAQLLADLMEHLETTGRQIDGTLAGHNRRLVHPERKDANDEPIFFRDAVRLAESHRIGLLSMAELLELYCRVLEKPAQKKELLSKNFNNVDEDR
jgi:hypothetical protein